jgi:Cu-processing system ATP-binding protein
MISFVDVTKSFGRLKALDKVTLELHDGKSFALVGPNGSGKTTLIKSLLGLVIPDSGLIHFNGKSIMNQWRYRDNIGYMPQIGHYPGNMTIGQLIEMMKNIRNTSKSIDEDLFEEFRLYKLLDKRLHALSGGTRQKVSAVLAFMFNPSVLILDEPTAGLDPLSVEALKEKITSEKAKGKLLLITSHILSDLDDIATDMVYMMDGKVEYHDSIKALKDETRENRLGKAIATLIRQRELISTITH